MGLLSWFSGLSPKSAETAVEAGKNITDGLLAGIDKIWQTDEEKSDAKQKASETILKFWELTANENTEQSRARRELARMTFQVFFFFLLAAAVVYGFNKEYAKFLLNLAGTITFLVSAIGIIYFGPHQISKIIKKK